MEIKTVKFIVPIHFQTSGPTVVTSEQAKLSVKDNMLIVESKLDLVAVPLTNVAYIKFTREVAKDPKAAK